MRRLAKLVLIVSIVMCCAFSGLAQGAQQTPPAKRKFRHHEPIDTTYDQAKDETLVRLDRMWISEERLDPTTLENNLMMTVFYTYPGKVPSVPRSVVIAFLSIGRGAVYSKDRHLTFYADKERFDLGTMDLIERQVLGYQNIREILSLPITYEMFAKIVNAKKVRIELGPTSWNLSESQLEALRDTASRVS
jgi:hypothetical protein